MPGRFFDFGVPFPNWQVLKVVESVIIKSEIVESEIVKLDIF